jgi:hypothetical protein
VALEGGYTMHVLADCMEAVALALLGRAEYSVVGGHASILQPVVTATETETQTATTVESLLPQLESSLVITTPILDRLDKARQVLAMYWKQEEEETLTLSSTPSSTSISRTAIQCINKSIAAMQATHKWRAIGLCPITLPTTTKHKNTARAPPKPKKPRTSKQQVVAKEHDDIDLSEALQSMSLDNK